MKVRSAREPIFTSLLAQDLYKITMLQAMLHHTSSAHAEYRFLCRNVSEFPLGDLLDEVNEELDALCALRFRADELSYLRTLPYLKPDFIEFQRIFQFHRPFIHASRLSDGGLSIVATGPQIHVMGFEIFVLAIVSELYFRRLAPEESVEVGRDRLRAKIQQLKDSDITGAQASLGLRPFEFFDFGLRRRFSGAWHREVVQTLAKEVPQFFKGTSNVLLARDVGIVPIGTMAHEYLQGYQAFGGRLRDSQKDALEDWVQEYRGQLGTALTDVISMDAFLVDFDLFFAKLFDGLRHDSGDPIVWGEKAIAHYRKLKIEPSTKRLVFSDGLNLPKALDLWRHFGDRVQTGFGIGTNLTNDVGHTPLNLVMKLMRVNGQPVAKLSDSPGKTMCDDETFLAYLRQVFEVKS